MSISIPVALKNKLQSFDQSHLISGWENLTDTEVIDFIQQLESVDFEELHFLYQSHYNQPTAHHPAPSVQISPPESLIRLPVTSTEKNEWQVAISVGEEMLAAGKVGIILVAGGQGTRLGFPHPKGMFPIGPVSDRTLFQHLIEQAIARGRLANVTIPYFVMTSDATHDETVSHFEENKNYGIATEDLYFFKQGNMPAVDAKTGKILIERPGQLCLSPDGHGGMLSALSTSGLLVEMKRRGIENLFYHQVDNPTTVVCDPALLGFHQLHQSEMTTKVAAKRNAKEKMGVVVSLDGKTEIIEYSDLSNTLAEQTDDKGQLLLWAGNMAIHVFNRSFFETLNRQKDSLPFHVAHKAVEHWESSCEEIESDVLNANKFERFIFDALPHAKTALVVEADRQREFNPVKNREGNDSPTTSRHAITQINRNWLTTANVEVATNIAIEISPLFALDATQFQAQIQAGHTPDLPEVMIADE